MTEEKVKQMLQSMVDFAISMAATDKPTVSEYFRFRDRSSMIQFAIGFADVPEEFKTTLMEKIKNYDDGMMNEVLNGRKDS